MVELNMTVLWVVLMVACIIIEIATMGLTTIWFAGGSLVAAVCSSVGVGVIGQIMLFIVVSFVLLLFTRPVAMRYFNRNRERTNVEGIIGKQAVVTAKINNLEGTGQVVVSGQEWTARTSEEGITLQEGKVVEILEVQGVKLIVKEV